MRLLDSDYTHLLFFFLLCQHSILLFKLRVHVLYAHGLLLNVFYRCWLYKHRHALRQATSGDGQHAHNHDRKRCKRRRSPMYPALIVCAL